MGTNPAHQDGQLKSLGARVTRAPKLCRASKASANEKGKA